MRIQLVEATVDFEAEFLAAVRRSRQLHRPWVSPPQTSADFRRYVQLKQSPTGIGYFVLSQSGALAGVINISEIVRGQFQSAYLGYYVFSPHERQGYMRQALAEVVRRAFRSHGLHRIEANIQPKNRASLALVQRLGFRREGYSLRYLKIRGRWRDHERWAITREDWSAQRRGGQRQQRPDEAPARRSRSRKARVARAVLRA